jgi:hypothetical protein
MISIHRIREITLLGKGHVTDTIWVDIQITTAPGIGSGKLTLYAEQSTPAYHTVERIIALLSEPPQGDPPTEATIHALPQRGAT